MFHIVPCFRGEDGEERQSRQFFSISGQGCFGGSKSTPTPGGVQLTPMVVVYQPCLAEPIPELGNPHVFGHKKHGLDFEWDFPARFC